MGRGWAALVVSCIVLASVGIAAIVIWQSHVHRVPIMYVTGGLLVILGIGFAILNRSVSDEYLQKNFGGAENAARMRQTWRRGWVGVLLGIITIVTQYVLDSIS